VRILACRTGGRSSYPFCQSKLISPQRAFHLIHSQTDVIKGLVTASHGPSKSATYCQNSSEMLDATIKHGCHAKMATIFQLLLQLSFMSSEIRICTGLDLCRAIISTGGRISSIFLNNPFNLQGFLHVSLLII